MRKLKTVNGYKTKGSVLLEGYTVKLPDYRRIRY